MSRLQKKKSKWTTTASKTINFRQFKEGKWNGMYILEWKIVVSRRRFTSGRRTVEGKKKDRNNHGRSYSITLIDIFGVWEWIDNDDNNNGFTRCLIMTFWTRSRVWKSNTFSQLTFREAILKLFCCSSAFIFWGHSSSSDVMQCSTLVYCRRCPWSHGLRPKNFTLVWRWHQLMSGSLSYGCMYRVSYRL